MGDNEKNQYSIVYVTVPDVDTGKLIANELLTKQFATFINMIPSMITLYMSDDDERKNEENMDSEVLMLAKIRREFSAKIISFIHEIHPYDIPEIYCLPIQGLSKPLRQHLNDHLAKQL